MKIVILGNGVSGITAARWVRKLSDHDITVISSESDYFFSRTALMYIYMGHMRLKDTQPYEPWFWEKNRIDLLRTHIKSIDTANQRLVASDGQVVEYDRLILAVGSRSNKFGWPGQDLASVQGLYSLQDLESMESASSRIKRAVIVGGGLIGIEMAEMFLSRHISVSMLVREKSYWSNVLPLTESQMVNQHAREHGLDLRLETELDEIIDDGNGSVAAVKTKSGEIIECEFVGLTAGVSPNVDFLKDSALEIQKGIVVDNHLQTNVENIYAIGDCAELSDPKPGRRSIEAIWYTGRMMGEVVAHNICGAPKEYDPGIWFNSAKFFDIEYQVYGYVPASNVEGIDHIVWHDYEEKKCIRVVYRSNDEVVIGFNLMGVRFRHEVCEKWISSQSTLNDVIQNIHLAFFDPEFYESLSPKVIKIYETKFDRKIPRKTSRLNQVLQFLKS